MKIALSAIGVLVIIFAALAIFAPQEFSMSNSLVINKPKSEVFAYLKQLKRQKEWSAWLQDDPALQLSFKGEDGQPGFIVSWDSQVESLGTAEQEIAAIQEGERIDTEIRYSKPMVSKFNTFMTTEEISPSETKVTLGMRSVMPFPFYIISFIYNACADMKGMITAKNMKSLNSVKSILEGDQAMAGKHGTVHFTREFNAPREQLWKVWTTPQYIKEWWGPEHYSAPRVTNDLRVGGKYNYAMKGPDGKTNYSGGTYKQIVPNEKIVSGDSFTDENGNPIKASAIGMPGNWADVLDVTIEFADAPGGKTLLTVTQVGLPVEMIEMCKMGWATSLDKIDRILAKLKQQ